MMDLAALKRFLGMGGSTAAAGAMGAATPPGVTLNSAPTSGVAQLRAAAMDGDIFADAAQNVMPAGAMGNPAASAKPLFDTAGLEKMLDSKMGLVGLGMLSQGMSKPSSPVAAGVTPNPGLSADDPGRSAAAQGLLSQIMSSRMPKRRGLSLMG